MLPPFAQSSTCSLIFPGILDSISQNHVTGAQTSNFALWGKCVSSPIFFFHSCQKDVQHRSPIFLARKTYSTSTLSESGWTFTHRLEHLYCWSVTHIESTTKLQVDKKISRASILQETINQHHHLQASWMAAMQLQSLSKFSKPLYYLKKVNISIKGVPALI